MSSVDDFYIDPNLLQKIGSEYSIHFRNEAMRYPYCWIVTLRDIVTKFPNVGQLRSEEEIERFFEEVNGRTSFTNVLRNTIISPKKPVEKNENLPLVKEEKAVEVKPIITVSMSEVKTLLEPIVQSVVHEACLSTLKVSQILIDQGLQQIQDIVSDNKVLQHEEIEDLRKGILQINPKTVFLPRKVRITDLQGRVIAGLSAKHAKAVYTQRLEDYNRWILSRSLMLIERKLIKEIVSLENENLSVLWKQCSKLLDELDMEFTGFYLVKIKLELILKDPLFTYLCFGRDFDLEYSYILFRISQKCEEKHVWNMVLSFLL